MIKVIAFDLVGVLVYEKDIELTGVEDKLERLFGSNLSDEEYLLAGRKYLNDNNLIIKITNNLIDQLYEIKEKNLFQKIKEIHPNIKIIITTNHVSYVREFVAKRFDLRYLDNIIISAEINKIKPNSNFYKYILEKQHIKPSELLFIDDNQDNIEGAKKLGINTIKYSKEMNLLEIVLDFMKKVN